MAAPLKMPRWGMIMEEGTLQSWLKEEGSPVSLGEGLAEVESDKAVNQIASPATGILARILVREGETVPVGSLLAVITEEGDAPDAADELIQAESAQKKAGLAQKSTTVPEKDRETGPSQAVPGETRRLRISPAARSMAHKEGLDWRQLSGSGPGGRIQVRDVQHALAGGASAYPQTPGLSRHPAAVRGLSPLRQAIARRTIRSIEAPQAALCRELAVDFLLQSRGEISFTALLIHRVVEALRRVPELNARLLPDGLVTSRDIHLGVVVATEGGILVPVIRKAQDKEPEQIQEIMRDFVKRGATASIRSEEMEGGTFTLSNAGPLGIDLFQPLLNPPEVAILGVGSIRKRPWVVEKRVAVRSTAFFCLATDHRAIDAAPAGAFLRELDALIAGA